MPDIIYTVNSTPRAPQHGSREDGGHLCHKSPNPGAARQPLKLRKYKFKLSEIVSNRADKEILDLYF